MGPGFLLGGTRCEETDPDFKNLMNSGFRVYGLGFQLVDSKSKRLRLWVYGELVVRVSFRLQILR